MTGLDPTTVLLGLFVACLLAATLVPFQSEAALVAALLTEGIDPVVALIVASLGNTMGSQINWAMGRALHHFRDRPWFPVTERQMARAEGWYARWGIWSLLMSWAPVVGDPLTVVAGVMDAPFWRFTLICGFAKTARYALVVWATLSF